MTRQQRRQASRNANKVKKSPIPNQVDVSQVIQPQHVPVKPSLLVRGLAVVLLSKWVLRRVNHPAARISLSILARDVGREDLATELEN